MISNLKNIYENQYDEYIFNNDDLNASDYEINTPIGWSFVCFDETISYYTDCNNKTLNLNINDKN